MNTSTLDAFVGLLRFAGRLVWHGTVLMVRVAAIGFDLLRTFMGHVQQDRRPVQTYNWGQPLSGAAFLSESDHALGRMGDDYAGN